MPEPVARGLTLLELVIAIAMLALVASLALPNFGAAAERARLKAAAETLATDIAEARFEAAQRGAALHIAFGGSGRDWCWTVASQPDCDCGSPAPCRLKAVHGRDHPGIDLLQAASVQLRPAGAPLLAGGALLKSSRGESLRVTVSALGRVRVCAADKSVPGYPAC